MDDQNKAHSQDVEEKVEEVHAENTPEEKSTKEDPRDNLTPDHPRFQEVYNELKELKGEKEKREQLEEQLEELRAQVNSQNSKQEEDVYTEEEEKALERIDKGLKKRGYLTKAELDEVQRTQERAQALKELQKEYSGENGYPKFDAAEVMAHAKKEGIGNLRAAYRDLHHNAIVKVEAKRNTTETVDSESPTGGAREVAADLDPAKIANMSDAEWAKKGPSIMQKFKNSIYGK